MKNVLRFLSGLSIFLFLLIVGGLVLFLFAPLILGGSLLLILGLMGAGAMISVLSFFVMIWHLTKRETKTKKSENFKISQIEEP